MGFEKEKVLLHGKMEMSMMGSGVLVCKMDSEKINGKMAPGIKDTIKMTKRMVLETTHGETAVPTVGNGRIIRCRVMAAIDGLMEGSI